MVNDYLPRTHEEVGGIDGRGSPSEQGLQLASVALSEGERSGNEARGRNLVHGGVSIGIEGVLSPIAAISRENRVVRRRRQVRPSPLPVSSIDIETRLQ